MENQNIVSKMNYFLHESAAAIVTWLEGILPKAADTWWSDCVLSSLSYTQREIANSKGFSKLSDFDLAALLRIANNGLSLRASCGARKNLRAIRPLDFSTAAQTPSSLYPPPAALGGVSQRATLVGLITQSCRCKLSLQT